MVSVFMQGFCYIVKYLTRVTILALLDFDLFYLLVFNVSSVGTVDIIMTFKNTLCLITYQIQNIQFTFINTNGMLISIAKSTS